ncbi:MAG TPA: hypothetical protein VGZ25_10360 [Gemmataceae bacterium]|nr:hypothetical protein [Gemmataceae bacterium]
MSKRRRVQGAIPSSPVFRDGQTRRPPATTATVQATTNPAHAAANVLVFTGRPMF